MATYTTVTARAQFSEVINKAAYGKERIFLTRRGKKIVAVVPIEDIGLLEKLEDMLDVQETKAALKEAKKKGTVTIEEFMKELGL